MAMIAKGQAMPVPQRPLHHLAPPTGWCNDPNGLIWHAGRLHVFYQHNPHDTRWGPMHWGHASSQDLLTWDHHPLALRPEAPYEIHPGGGGCFSGSAVTLPDGRLALCYTAHGHDGRGDFETQALAISHDGLAFERHPANPVLLPGRYPPGDFRDPKVWRDGDRYLMVVGTRIDGRGAVVLFASDDLVTWHDLGPIYRSDATMCECPDFFELAGRHVLIYSPIGVVPRRVRAVVGDFDRATHRFTPVHTQVLDHGPDFYAPQTTLDPAGRRLMVGWLGSWERDTPASMRRAGFAWMMTLVRQLDLQADRVICRPASLPDPIAMPRVSAVSPAASQVGPGPNAPSASALPDPTPGGNPSAGRPGFIGAIEPGRRMALPGLDIVFAGGVVEVAQDVVRKNQPARLVHRIDGVSQRVEVIVDTWAAELWIDGQSFATFCMEHPPAAPAS